MLEYYIDNKERDYHHMAVLIYQVITMQCDDKK